MIIFYCAKGIMILNHFHDIIGVLKENIIAIH